MSKKVKVDGRIIVVPDDATPEEIDAISQQGAGAALTPEQQKAKNEGYFHQSNPYESVAKIWTPDMGTVKSFGGDLADAAVGIGKTLTAPVPGAEIVKGYISSVQDAKRAADEAAARGDWAESAIETGAAALPLVGPLIHGIYGKSGGVGASRVAQAMAMAPESGSGNTGINPVTNKIGKIARAEGDPVKVYNRVLNNAADVPAEVPKTTPRIDAALINKIDINYPDVAARIKSGSATLKDLDIARQVANDAGKAAYTARGLPTQMSKGFKGAADKLRGELYPQVDELNNLPEGTASKLKDIQGNAVSMGRPPKWGHFPTRWPTVAAERLAIRPALDAYRNIRTRMIDSELPKELPKIEIARPPRALLPEQSGSGNWSLGPTQSEATAMSPGENAAAIMQDVRKAISSRLLRLPAATSEASGPVIQVGEGAPGMTPGENIAAIMQEIRKRRTQNLLPEKSSPILLGPSR